MGIPGTELAYTAYGSSRGAARRAAAQERRAAAEANRIEKIQKQESAEQAVQAEQDSHTDLLNCWREMPDLVTVEQYRADLKVKPFVPPEDFPSLPEEAALMRSFKEKTAASGEVPKMKRRYLVLVGFVAWMALLAVGVSLSLFWALIIVGAGFLYRRIDHLKQVDELVKNRWTTEFQSIKEEHSAQKKQHEESVAQLAGEWGKIEATRIALGKKVLDGDADTLNEVVSSELAGLDFPFETECSVLVDDKRVAYILLDLPEIEDVIPETKKKALKSGDIKEVKRTGIERRADYAHLVAGLALMISRIALSVAPVIDEVHIAAYTQRRKARTGVIEDEYVFESTIWRADAGKWDCDSMEPLSALKAVDTRIDLRDDKTLKAITKPAWDSIE